MGNLYEREIIININKVGIEIVNVDRAEGCSRDRNRSACNRARRPFLDKDGAGSCVADRQAGRTIYAQVGASIGGDRRRRQRYGSRGLNFESGSLIGVDGNDVVGPGIKGDCPATRGDQVIDVGKLDVAGTTIHCQRNGPARLRIGIRGYFGINIDLAGTARGRTIGVVRRKINHASLRCDRRTHRDRATRLSNDPHTVGRNCNSFVESNINFCLEIYFSRRSIKHVCIQGEVGGAIRSKRDTIDGIECVLASVLNEDILGIE